MTARLIASRLTSISLLCLAAIAFVPKANAFDYDDLALLIEERDIGSIEALLPELPAEYLENYTLVHHSRSLHGASPDFPRVIIFGPSARLILTFNGKPEQDRFRDLEIMYFRDDEPAFELRSVSFDRGARFSEPNPKVCQSCHGINPRPIWSSYEYSEDKGVEHWPGFYGATHDAPSLSADKGAAFERFRALAKTHPRYRHLRLEHPDSLWFPYGPGAFKHQFRPNNRLGNLFARLNATRLAHHLRSGSFYETYPGLSLLWVLQCPQAADEEFLTFAEARFRQTYPGFAGIAAGLENTKMRLAFMFEKLLSGPEVFTWNMTLDPFAADARFFTGIVRIDELVAAELLSGIAEDHWLKDFYVPWSQQQLYDTFRPGYYELNVAPGGVGARYEALGSFYDRDRARESCTRLAREAANELDRFGS